MAKASDVIRVGRTYKNYQEKRTMGTRSQMWDFHWRPGTANLTIWAMLYQDYTGRNFQGQPWCAIFGSDIFVLAYGLEQAKELLGGDLPYNCQDFVNRHKKDKRLNHSPAPGCPVIYWTGGKYGHWGTVTSVDKDGGGFTAVEGNTSGGADKIDPDGGAVVEKWHSLDSKTLFWHPDFEDESPAPTTQYKIQCGASGLTVTASYLNIRKTPGSGSITGVYKKGDNIQAAAKCFIDGKPWYQTEKGWISARYAEGWVLEENGLWWYVMEGYHFSVSRWQLIEGKWYYFDQTGYMASARWIEQDGNEYYVASTGEMARNAYIKSLDKELYYRVGPDGAWRTGEDTPFPDTDTYPIVL